MSRRIIVCGSRDWTDDHDDIDRTLEQALCIDLNIGVGSDVTIVHGASGIVDLVAEDWAIANFNWKSERHVADWKTHGKAAGPIRNREIAANKTKPASQACASFIRRSRCHMRAVRSTVATASASCSLSARPVMLSTAFLTSALLPAPPPLPNTARFTSCGS